MKNSTKSHVIQNGLIVLIIFGTGVLVRVFDLGDTVFFVGVAVAIIIGMAAGAFWIRYHPDSDSTT